MLYIIRCAFSCRKQWNNPCWNISVLLQVIGKKTCTADKWCPFVVHHAQWCTMRTAGAKIHHGGYKLGSHTSAGRDVGIPFPLALFAINLSVTIVSGIVAVRFVVHCWGPGRKPGQTSCTHQQIWSFPPLKTRWRQNGWNGQQWSWKRWFRSRKGASMVAEAKSQTLPWTQSCNLAPCEPLPASLLIQVRIDPSCSGGL